MKARIKVKNDFNLSIFMLFFAYTFSYYFFTIAKIEIQGAIVVRSLIGLLLFTLLLTKGIKNSHAFVTALIIFTSFMNFLVTGNQLSLNVIFLTISTALLLRIRPSTQTLAFNGIFVILIFITIHLALIKLNVVSTNINLVGLRSRNDYGLNHPNHVGLAAFALGVLTFIYLNNNKTPFVVSCIVSSVPLALAFYADSRSAMLFFIFFMITSFLIPNKLNPAIKKTIVLSALVSFTLITFLLAYSTNANLDVLLSARPYLFRSFLSEVSYSNFFFGISFQGKLIDNSYLAMIFSAGTPIIIISIFILLIKRDDSKADYLPLLIACMAYGVSESLLIRPENLLSSIFFYYLFLGKSYENKPSI